LRFPVGRVKALNCFLKMAHGSRYLYVIYRYAADNLARVDSGVVDVTGAKGDEPTLQLFGSGVGDTATGQGILKFVERLVAFSKVHLLLVRQRPTSELTRRREFNQASPHL
jgi:hypothetical protein